MTRFRCIVFALLVMMTSHAVASGKMKRTYYTDAHLAAMRRNIERYPWAKSMKKRIVAAADKWLKYSDEDLRRMVPPPQLARAQYVHETGCPVHGLKIRKFGTYAWKVSLKHPFKVQCPVGKEFYPDNDFAAYYRSCFVGGKYQPDKGDRSLLKGKIVDDGWGWDKPDDNDRLKYWFVGFYVHWGLAQRVVHPVLRDCSQAALVTGDEKYAHKAAVVLWQLAQHYPDYRYEKQSRRGTELNRHYWGRLLYHTWETGTVDVAALAYDAVFPFIARDAALQKMVGQNADQIKEHIEGRMLRPMAGLIMDGSHTIQGNYGSHQRALLRVALVCGDEEHSPRRSEMIDWILNNDDAPGYTDFSLNDALYNCVFRDGVPFESPGYNIGWVRNLLPVAEMLDRCGVDVFKMPRIKALCDWPIDMTCAGRFTPALGDSGNMYQFACGRIGQIYIPAFRHYRAPRYAKLYAGIKGTPVHDLYEECLDEEIAKAAEGYKEELGTSSFLFPAYGMSILQTGSAENRTALMLHQGSGRHAHAHYDVMHIDLYAHQVPLIPDFGYPETCNSQDPRRFGFFCHTISHNTVMVNQTRGGRAVGELTAFDPSGFCKVVDGHAEGVYPGITNRYRRTMALIDASPTQAYVVDIFRVAGGEQHDWIVHGTDADLESSLPLSKPRTQGTLAGPEVKYGYFYDNEKMAKAAYGSVSYYPYTGSAFMYLYNVQWEKGSDPFCLKGPKGAAHKRGLTPFPTVTWKLKHSGERVLKQLPPVDGLALRAHLIGDDETVLVCDGKPQKNNNYTPEAVKFLLRRRKGKDLQSTFVTVFEPYKDKPFIRSVARVALKEPDSDVVALRIDRTNGQADFFFSAPDASKPHETENGIVFQAQVAALTVDEAGQVTRAKLTNGWLLQKGDYRITAAAPQAVKIASIDYKAGTVALAEPALENRELVGSWVAIGNDLRSTLYRVEKVISPTAFSIGTQSPRCGRLLPKTYKAETKQLTTSNFSAFTRPGMHLTDENGKILGRIAAVTNLRVLTVDGPAVEVDQLPDADGDGRRRIWVMDIGSGDEVRLGASVSYERK